MTPPARQGRRIAGALLRGGFMLELGAADRRTAGSPERRNAGPPERRTAWSYESTGCGAVSCASQFGRRTQ